MDVYRKIAIVLIVVLFSYILFRLSYQRINIKKEIEGFTPSESNVLSIQKANKIPPNIKSMNKNILSKKLGDMYIKAAYGGGYDGEDISADMFKYTISLGYRYVVIHVFYDAEDKENPEKKAAVVGFSTNYLEMANSAKKTMPLTDVVQLIQQNAFSQTAPNGEDPFFLHIIPAYQKSKSDTDQIARGNNTQLNSQIEQALQVLHGTNRSVTDIDMNSTLDSLKGKMVIVMDGEALQGNMTANLKSLIGFSVPSKNLESVKLMKAPRGTTSPTEINKDKTKDKTKDKWSVILPIDENGLLLTNNSDYINTYRGYKMNASPVCMWGSRIISTALGGGSGNKTNLGDYEELFSKEGGSAFIVG